MANLFFPQLSSGAIAQFPFTKNRSIRTVENLLADGSMFVSPDPASARRVWKLSFDELSSVEMHALQALFTTCSGPFAAFTFIDPADNMLCFSGDLTNTAWTVSPNLQVAAGLSDPNGGFEAFAVTNAGQVTATVSQTMLVPANYQYCFSVFAQSSPVSNVTLSRAGSSARASATHTCGPIWNRFISEGRLNDSGTLFTAGIQLMPGQTINLFAPQVEPQIEPSPYRATASASGVYANSHWTANQLWFSADRPNSFATSFSIESAG